jgi:hypothetical protein
MTRLALFGLMFLVLAGCGGGAPTLAPVSGKITFDGKPVANAMVSFIPIGPHSNISSNGRTNANGEYTLTTVKDNKAGALVGKHRVSIAVDPTVSGDSDLPANLMPKNRPPRIPAKYQGEESELSCDVPADGKTDANFELKSK